MNTRFLLKDNLEGIGVYTKEIVSRMVLNHPEIDFVFFFDRPFDESYVFADNVTPVVVSPPARHPFLWKIWFDVAIPRMLKKHKMDVFFSPDGYLSLNSSVPQAVTIHDLAFEHFPQGIGFLVRKFYQRYVPRYAKSADHIFAVSEYTKNDISKTYGVDSDKISVTYNSIDRERFRLDESYRFPQLLEELSKDSYFLYVGAQHPRKNIDGLLKAFDVYKTKTLSKTKLVIVGRQAWGNKEIEHVFDTMTNKSDVVFTGRVSDEELIQVYQYAKALVYIPFFEGFGIPIIEAQACGTPVITSNVTSMPEVIGRGGICVDPYNHDEVADAMLRLDDNIVLSDYTKKGIENILRFDWNRSAEHIVEVLKKIQK